jgi:Protein of unknown function (DUF 659)
VANVFFVLNFAPLCVFCGSFFDLWKHLNELEAPGRGNTRAECKGCKHAASQNPASWWVHLADCEETAASVRERAQAEIAAAERKKGKKRARKELSDEAESLDRAQPTLDGDGAGSFKLSSREAADAAVARWAYANGRPLRSVEDFFLKAAVAAITKVGSSYKLPTRERLTNALLQDELRRLREEQSQVVQHKSELYGLTLLSDGWSDFNRRPLLNIIKQSPAGEFFMESIDTTGSKKTMAYIAGKLSPHIDETVDFVVMDGACKGAIEILVAEFPWLSGAVCSTHSIDLLMKDAGKMQFAEDIMALCKRLVQFVNSHHATKALFERFSKLVLLSPGGTRFGYYFIMSERLLTCKVALKKMFVSDDYDSWLKAQKAEVQEEAR